MSDLHMDGFTGTLLASESLLDGVTILHGSGGCRSLPMSVSIQKLKRDHPHKEGEFFFHNSRMPCTYIDLDDYIYGASSKIELILTMLSHDDVRFATIVESPGVSLIGDSVSDCIQSAGLSDKAVVLDSGYYSEDFSTGFDQTLTAIVRRLYPGKRPQRPNAVNLIGLPFTISGYEYVLEELTFMLHLIGVDVIASIGSGSTIRSIRDSFEASYNIVVIPEYCQAIGGFYQDIGIPSIASPSGAPVGYDAISDWIASIGSIMGLDVSPALDLIQRERERTERIFDNSSERVQYMNFRTYSISCESSVALPLMAWLTKTFKMVPKSIELIESPIRLQEIKDFLERIGGLGSLEEPFGRGYSDVLFGIGSMVYCLKARGECLEAFDVRMPSNDYVDLMPKSILGLQGCRMMLDRICNAR